MARLHARQPREIGHVGKNYAASWGTIPGAIGSCHHLVTPLVALGDLAPLLPTSLTEKCSNDLVLANVHDVHGRQFLARDDQAGEIRRDEVLDPMKIGAQSPSRRPRSRVNDIVLGPRGITADAALHLARYFGLTPEVWINLQARCDFDVAERTLHRRIEGEVSPARWLIARKIGTPPI
jgi:antitoxin HigA-1